MDKLSIYIHIPFCEQKCPYCDFYSKSDKAEYDNYTDKLIESIVKNSRKYPREITTVYFGGGTPSVIGSERLCAILDSIKQHFIVLEDAEITVEVNPCSAENLDFYAMKCVGFNRLSIGLQSANENELKILGRRHTSDDVKKTIERARNVGFDNISLDLMLCVPNQTKSSLSESIRFCKDCDVEHISAYILKFEENTPFFNRKNELDKFDDDSQAQMYLHAVSELEKNGYNQYEISNFSKPGFEGKHNLRYWRDKEYIGLGPSAHSFINSERFYYERDFDKFYNDITVYDGTGGDIEEYIMLALRLKEGLNLNKLKSRYNFTPEEKFTHKLNKLKSEGLIIYDDNIISLTKEGFLVSNTIINYILDSLQ